MSPAIVDRFEGEYAVMEIDGEMKTIRCCDLPAETREGDVCVWKITVG